MPSATVDLIHPPSAPSKPNLSTPRLRFHRLVEDVRDTLGSDNGITSSDELRNILQDRLEKYTSEDAGWQEYGFQDPSQTFTRNLVDRGNGNYNLLVLVWSPGRESVIHDHADSHCIMKILKGSLTETRYEWPTSTGAGKAMATTKQTTFRQDQVTYMADTLGLHKISNPNPREYAVSLHLYTPPNAALEGCNVFDPETGESKHVKTYNYYSENGRKNAD